MTTGFRTVVGAVIVEHGQAFVIRRSAGRRLFPNCWDVPGGHVEEHETVEVALDRELSEETGWRLAGILARLDEHRWLGDDGVERVEHDFLVGVEGDLENPRLELDKHPEWRWLGLQDLDVLLEGRRPGDDLTRRIVKTGLEAAARLEHEGTRTDGRG